MQLHSLPGARLTGWTHCPASTQTNPRQCSLPRSPISPAFSSQGFHTTVSARLVFLNRIFPPAGKVRLFEFLQITIFDICLVFNILIFTNFLLVLVNGGEELLKNEGLSYLVPRAQCECPDC